MEDLQKTLSVPGTDPRLCWDVRDTSVSAIPWGRELSPGEEAGNLPGPRRHRQPRTKTNGLKKKNKTTQKTKKFTKLGRNFSVDDAVLEGRELQQLLLLFWYETRTEQPCARRALCSFCN